MQFDWGSPLEPLRVLCGAAFIPHIAAKIFTAPLTLGFFRAAGYRPAALFMYLALSVEACVAVCLILGWHVRLAALVAALFMLVAAISVLKVSKGRWLWNAGGCEYCVFWASMCVLLYLYS